MKQTVHFQHAIEIIRPLELERFTPLVLFSEQTAILLRNCEVCSHLAQEIADPHGSSEMSHLSAEIVGAAAECKLALTGLLQNGSQKKALRYTARVVRNYKKLKKAMERLGASSGQDWGVIIPTLL